MLAGRKEGASFGTQFLYAVITVGVLQLVLGLDDMLSATIAVIISATLYLGLMPIAHLRLRNHPARSTPKGNPCVAPFTELGQTLKLAFTTYPECAKYIALVVCCENGGGAVGIGLLTIYAQNVLGFGFLETGIISLLLLLLGAPLCVIFPKITAKLGPKKSWALILVMFVVPGVVIPAAFSEPGFGAFIGVLVVYGVVGAMQLAWYITYLQASIWGAATASTTTAAATSTSPPSLPVCSRRCSCCRRPTRWAPSLDCTASASGSARSLSRSSTRASSRGRTTIAWRSRPG